MKYFSLSLLAFVFVLSVSTVSVAALAQESSGTLVLGSTPDFTVSVPLSPGVTAGYEAGDWKGTNDWFVTGAYHTAGSKVYATASSISQLWEADVDTDAALADTFNTIPSDYANAGSDDLWSENGWK